MLGKSPVERNESSVTQLCEFSSLCELIITKKAKCNHMSTQSVI